MVEDALFLKIFSFLLCQFEHKTILLIIKKLQLANATRSRGKIQQIIFANVQVLRAQ